MLNFIKKGLFAVVEYIQNTYCIVYILNLKLCSSYKIMNEMYLSDYRLCVYDCVCMCVWVCVYVCDVYIE